MKKIVLFSILLLALAPSAWSEDSQGHTLEQYKIARQVADDFQIMKFLTWELEEATQPYFAGNFEIAKYSLSHVTSILEFYAKQELSRSYAGVDLALTYFRLGKIAESENNSELQQDYFVKGTSTYNETTGKKYSTKELLSLLEKIDTNQKNSERQFPTFSNVMAPNHTMKADEK